MPSIFPYLLFIKIILTHLLMFCSIKILTGCIIVGIYENLSIKPLQLSQFVIRITGLPKKYLIKILSFNLSCVYI